MSANEVEPDPTDDPVHEFVHSLREFDLVMDRYRADFAARCGISVNDSVILSALLVPGQKHRPSDLAARLGITSGSLTAMLDRLESADMIVRERDVEDRRSVRIAITKSGAARLLEGRDRLREVASTSIPAESLAPMTSGLRGFTAAIQDLLARSTGTGRPGRIGQPSASA